MVEIDLRETLLIVRKKLWIIVLITFFFAGSSGIISYYFLAPEYETYTTLIMWRPLEYQQKVEYDDVLLNQKLVSTYSEIAKSRVVANELMVNLGLSLSYEEFAKKINVSLVKDTAIIKISVRDNSGEAAAKIANEISNVFMKHVVKMMNIENIQVVDRAEIPLEPAKPKPVINMLIASVLGALLSTCSILVYVYFDNTVRTPEDMEKSLGLPVIGVIPKVT